MSGKQTLRAKISPKQLSSIQNTPMHMRPRARLANSLKDYDAALKDSTEAIKLDAANAIAYAQRAMANRNLGHDDDADRDVAQARQLGWSE